MQTAVSFLRHSTVRKAASPLSEDVSVWHVSLMLPAPCDTCPDVSLFSSQSEDWNFDTRYLWSNVAPDDLSLPPGGSFALSCWHASRDSAQFSDTCIWWRHVWLYGCQPGGQSVTVKKWAFAPQSHCFTSTCDVWRGRGGCGGRGEHPGLPESERSGQGGDQGEHRAQEDADHLLQLHLLLPQVFGLKLEMLKGRSQCVLPSPCPLSPPCCQGISCCWGGSAPVSRARRSPPDRGEYFARIEKLHFEPEIGNGLWNYAPSLYISF